MAVALIVGWQILHPSKFLLAALARVPYCNGVAFDFAPADSETAKKHRKYVALTLDDGPCPYNSEPASVRDFRSRDTNNMQRDADQFISNNERDFIIQAIKEEVRIDGRSPYECRELKVQFALDDRSATVQLGATTAMAAIAAELTAPYNDRSREGSIRFNVELSPMASAAFAAGRPGEGAVELARLVERCLRGSGALDLEALCVLPGRKVWSLRVDVTLLDACGNLVDAACLAALAALLGFRKPQVEVDASDGDGAGSVVILPPEVREPQPLTLHHLPLPHTFAIFEAGSILVCDPCLSEEAAAAGSATLFMNPHGEVCGWQMAEGVGLDTSQMMRCVRLAAARSPELAAALQEALKQHELARVAARVRRHTGAAAAAAAAAGPGFLPGQQEQQQQGVGGAGAGAAAAACRGQAAAAALAAAAAAGVGGGDRRNVTVLADTDEADEKLQSLMAEIREAVQRQQLRDEELEQQAAAAAAAAAKKRKAAASQDGEQQQQQEGSSDGVAAAAAAEPAFLKPPSLAAASKTGPGVARLAGSTGSKRSAASDSSLDAFLGKGRTSISKAGGGAAGGAAAAGGGPFSAAGPAAAKFESLDAIEQILFQAGPKDLAGAVKPKKKHKKKPKAGE